MKAVILAGGLGTRLSEETQVKPKPMVEIGGRPILWHIMKIYAAHGINDFVICCGYKGYLIKEYFSNYVLHSSDVTFDLVNKTIEHHNNNFEPWRVTLVDTGDNSQTGGRLKIVARFVSYEAFCFTYGDGLADINITKLIQCHQKSGALATVTAVQPLGRFGALSLSANKVQEFVEKPIGDGGWINAGFFVLEPQAINYIDNDSTSWENEPLKRLAIESKLSAYRHEGFWQPMDTLRDCNKLNELWSSGNAPWKIWDGAQSNIKCAITKSSITTSSIY